MNLPVIVFFVFALFAVAGAVMLILAREPIHSALALILVMAALATLYLLLGAEFIAAVQMIVYAGAVMVLFVFVIMLLIWASKNARTSASSRNTPASRSDSFSCSKSPTGCGARRPGRPLPTALSR